MECRNGRDLLNGLEANHGYGHKMDVRHPLYPPPPPAYTCSPWFDTRVFYVRFTGFMVDDSNPPDRLTVSYFPLVPDTVVKINGGRSSDFSDCCVSAQLRRDRADRRSEEATYVNTDSVKISGTVGFEMCDGDDLLLSGVLELSSVEGAGGAKGREKNYWGIKCESHMPAAPARGGSVFKGRGRYAVLEKRVPTVDVYVAGSYAGQPVILTDTVQLFSPRKYNKKAMMMLDTIPEYESTEKKNNGAFFDSLQVPEDNGVDKDDHFSTNYGPKSMYPLSKVDYMGSEDGELPWFNAGIRVGVGISLGFCIGVGLGVGMLISSYQTTTRKLKRRFF